MLATYPYGYEEAPRELSPRDLGACGIFSHFTRIADHSPDLESSLWFNGTCRTYRMTWRLFSERTRYEILPFCVLRML